VQVPQGYERWMSTPRFERIRRIYRSDSAEGPIGGVLERISLIELDYSGQISGGDRLCPMGILRERCNFRTQFVGERWLWRIRRYDRFWLWVQPVNAPPHYEQVETGEYLRVHREVTGRD